MSYYVFIDLMQKRHNFIANALEVQHFYIKPLICGNKQRDEALNVIILQGHSFGF